ncbi:MAG: hypothetical protein NT154_03120 [Verrucomicrobia bacterium]|nr:hypothetical protein [Verrucomicrobiota bacterium]
MSSTEDKAPIAWQPLTPHGVAGFARASLGRLLLVQFMVALLAAGTLVWFVQKCWFPIIGNAIRGLPLQGEIRSGRLDWSGPSTALLADGRFLALVVDLDHTGGARSPAHVQIEFGRSDFEVYSLLGYLRGAYPRTGVVAFNRTELGPWWGAWAPAILAIAAGLVVVVLMITWGCLATMYCLPAWLIGVLANRGCGLGGSWRLAGASLMPGALLICAALVLYGWGALDLVRLTVAGVAHLVLGWVYLFVSPLCLPPQPKMGTNRNPFV